MAASKRPGANAPRKNKKTLAPPPDEPPESERPPIMYERSAQKLEDED